MRSKFGKFAIDACESTVHGYGMSGQTSNQHNVPWLVARRKRLGGGGWAAARA